MSALDKVFRLCEEGHMVHDSVLVDASAELAQLRADLQAAQARIAELEARNGELAAYASSIESQLKQYQRMAALRQ